MDYSSQQPLFTKTNIFIFAVLIILIISVPIAVYLLRTDQATTLRSKASQEAVNEIKFKDPVKQDPSTGQWVTTSPTIKLDIESPYGPRR